MPDIPKFVPTIQQIEKTATDAITPYIGYPKILSGIPKIPTVASVAASANAYLPDSLRGSNDKVPDAPVTKPHDPSDNKDSSDKEIKVDFQPNLLDNYDMYTYHFKLFITSLKNSTDGTVLSPKAQTILAESGVTDITIDNVEFKGLPGPSIESGTGTLTELKFQIHEPGSASLLDKMYYESLALGIGNWLVMPCYLQLEFRGRTVANSDPVTSGGPGTLAGLKWIWPIKLTNMMAQVNTSGTKYDCVAIFYDEFVQSNALFTTSQQVSLTGLKNFGDAMQQLKEKLNTDAHDKAVANYSIQDTFEIVVDEELKGIDIAIPSMNKTSTRGADYIDLQAKTATYNPGTSIDKIIDSILGSTEFYQKALQSALTSTDSPQTANAAAPMRDFWRIVTETKPTAYDVLRQDNAVHSTIYIIKYNLGLVQANSTQTGQTPDTLQAARKRLATYNDSGILKKKYNYIFTGLNDQVINFDLNMNFSYSQSLSRFGGIYSDTNNSDLGVVQRSHTQQAQSEAIDKTKKSLAFIHNPLNGAENIAAEKVNQLAYLAKAEISDALKSNLSLSIKDSSFNDIIAKAKTARIVGGLLGNGEIPSQVISGISLAKPTKSNPTYKFISDVDPTSQSAKDARKLYETVGRGKLRPTPFRESNQDTNNSFGLDSNSDPGRARTASLFSTALYSGLDASLMNIKMTIKGDPYWIFPKISEINGRLQYKSNMDPQKAIRILKQGEVNKDHIASVNPYGTDNFIVVRFRAPKIYNDVDGYTDAYSEIETFSGIYKINSITSRFEMGKFTQELSGILDDLINLKDFPDFLKQIESEMRKPDKQIVDTGNLPLKIPSTAEITDKIKDGGANLVKGVTDTVRNQAGEAVGAVTSAVKQATVIGTNLPKLPDIQKVINVRLPKE
jgi:hypothetical protein